ncbi:BufA1 family periplasmic bufferin-type metallophore [Ferrovibrio xuzhouensis]|uniref:DUF2282 domain-containing protein n=1 Tax=Ferrovibrio xuzhouensis TaxID=1576914 RepID=A0ABV7VB34_9PROT
MNRNTAYLAASAVAAALAIGALSGAAQAQSKTEKCFGVAKAGKNDCQTATSSCAGTSKKDGQTDAWLAVPTGTCVKIVGGSLESKKS